jgi:nucleoside-diphosphate-sugar epimerase
MKKILVIGGSYFVGRVFCTLASNQGDLSLFVVNRGRYTLDKPHIAEYPCDRHEVRQLVEMLPPFEFDALVDFCAYEPLDIDPLVEALGSRIGQYICFSTSSVYAQGDKSIKTEEASLITRFGDDPVSQYLAKKALLEVELEQVCKLHKIPYTILRPSFIYGPYNYAPRESYFVKLIAQNKPVPMPVDATAQFSMVFVTDIAHMLLAALKNEDTYNRVFNMAGSEMVDYKMLFSELERCNGTPFLQDKVTVQQVIDENIPLPFPLIDSELCDGNLIAETLGMSYTKFSEGFEKTFRAFKGVFAHQG